MQIGQMLRLRQLEKLAMIAMHACPALFLRSRKLVPETPAAELADLYRDELVIRLSRMPILLRSLMFLGWAPVIVSLALCMTAANGRLVSRKYGRSVFGQFAAQIRLAFLHGVVPYYFYSLELHEPENQARAHEYLWRTQLKTVGLYARYYRAWPQRNKHAKLLNDKREFDLFCNAHCLPVAPLIGLVEDGRFTWTDDQHPGLPHNDIFVKPIKEKGGNGAERWLFRNGKFVGRDDNALSADELLGHLARASKKPSRWGSESRPLLIQHRLVNHPQLADLCAGALSTIRMYTLWNEKGEVEHLAATLRSSYDPKSILDIAGSGALAARIDPVTGTLGPATDPTVLARGGWFHHHPYTGAKITGRTVPCWPEAVALVRRAHRHLESAALIGWDVAITRDGPVIVEGNKAPDIEIEQRLNGPWGNARFGELLLFHLQLAEQRLATPPPRIDMPIAATGGRSVFARRGRDQWTASRASPLAPVDPKYAQRGK